MGSGSRISGLAFRVLVLGSTTAALLPGLRPAQADPPAPVDPTVRGAAGPFEGGLTIRHVPVETAFAKKVRILHVVDGNPYTTWRPGVVTYQLTAGGEGGDRPLEDDSGEVENFGDPATGLPIWFHFPKEETWNAVYLESPGKPLSEAAFFACDAGNRRIGEAAGVLKGNRANERLVTLAESKGARAEIRALGAGGQPPRFILSDVRFLRVSPGLPAGGGEEAGLDRFETAAEFAGPLPDPPAGSGVDGVTLALKVAGAYKGPLGISIRDASHPIEAGEAEKKRTYPRDHFAVSVPVETTEAAPWVNVHLDLEDYLPAAPGRLSYALTGPAIEEGKVRLAAKPAAGAAAEHVRTLLRSGGLRYSHGAEGWRWPDEVYAIFEEVLRLDPAQAGARKRLDRMLDARRNDERKKKGGRRGRPEPVPADFDPRPYLPGTDADPMWARLQVAHLRQAQDTVHWFIDNLQMEDGQLGGGWNDDVELSYQWPFLWLIAGDEKVRAAMRKVADGIWDSGRIKDGYCRVVLDVEHACEDTTCSQPQMLLLDYGDPRYVERCMETAKHLAEWTRVNKRGHRHFRSCFFNVEKIDTTEKRDIDHPYNVYSLVPASVLAWWNGHPQTREWLAQIGKAWVEDMAQEGVPAKEPKPKWSVPREIWGENCEIGHYSGTWKASAAYYGGGAGNVWHFVLGCFQMTRDDLYLQPFEGIAVDPGQRVCPLLRKLAGKESDLYRKEDKNVLLDAEGSESAPRDFENAPYQAWLATRDKKWLERGFLKELYDCVSNRFLYTEAYPPTDRTYASGREMLALTYLGGWGVDRDHFPWLAVSWEGFGTDVAALVLQNDTSHLKVLLYNFAEKPIEGAARVWELEASDHRVAFGPDGDGDDQMDKAEWNRELPLRRHARIPFTLPSRALHVLETRQLVGDKNLPLLPRADLAVMPRDLRWDPETKKLAVSVHNIGTREAKKFSVTVAGKDGKEIASKAIDSLAAPLDFKPKIATVEFEGIEGGREIRVSVTPDTPSSEITESNNEATAILP